MTTTDTTPELNDIFGHDQIARMAALQGVASFAKGMFGTTNPGVLIELADYVIGDDEPFDPVALARKAREVIAAERGENYNGYDPVYVDGHDERDAEGFVHEGNPGPGAHEAGPLADWERELLDAAYVNDGLGSYYMLSPAYYQAKTEESFTVSDLAGFLTLPTTAVLEDEDGDIWRHGYRGWMFTGDGEQYTPGEIFADFGVGGTTLHFVVTNPEVLT